MAAVRQVNPQWPPSGERRASLACQNPEKHLIIAGTGRAGTSFLVRYLTELGLDTTLARNGDRASWDAEANAGLENLLVSGANLPYVIKSPWISEYVEQILKEERFKIDAFIVPVRDLVEAQPAAWSSSSEPFTSTIPGWRTSLTDHGKPTAIPRAGWSIRSTLSTRRDCWRFSFTSWSSGRQRPAFRLFFPYSQGSRPTGNICTNPCDRFCRRRLPRTWLAPPTPESRTRRRFGSRAKFSRIRPATSSTGGSRGAGRITRARPKSTTSRFGAKSAGFARS